MTSVLLLLLLLCYYHNTTSSSFLLSRAHRTLRFTGSRGQRRVFYLHRGSESVRFELLSRQGSPSRPSKRIARDAWSFVLTLGGSFSRVRLSDRVRVLAKLVSFR